MSFIFFPSDLCSYTNMTIQNHGVNVNLFVELALISEGWANNVRISVGKDGKITEVERGTEPGPDDRQLRNRILLPAIANLHSHSFQRSMAQISFPESARRPA